jgi:protein AroM
MKIGTITIGQSPRVDIVPEFRRALCMDAEIVERGALDGLSLEEVRNLAPRAGDYVLVTRMSDGTEVKIAERHILDRLKGCVGDLEQRGVDLIALFCTGEFPELRSSRLLLRPDRLLANVVSALLPRGALGVVVPTAEQVPILEKRWRREGVEVACDSVSPYTASAAEIERTAERVAARNPDLVVLDCMGFTLEAKKVFRDVTRRPVVLPRSVLGRIAGALLEG